MATKKNLNILSRDNLKSVYKRYMSKYNDTKKWMKKHNMSMYDKTPYTIIEFDAMYSAAANELDKSGKTFSSDRSKQSAAIDMLVERQRSEITQAQAQAYQKFYQEEYGTKLTMDYIYRELPDILREANEKLKGDGVVSSIERKAIISAAFFGSPT